MNRNLAGSIYGRSSLKIAYFVPIRYQTWPPQTILVSDWLISKKSRICKKSYDDPLGYLCTFFFLLVPLDKGPTNFTCPTAVSPSRGQSDKRYCRGQRFQRRRFFRNQPIRNKNCLWWPCMLIP
jgi:hypothetical protein